MKISKTPIAVLISLILLGTIIGCRSNDYSAPDENKELYKIESEKSVYDLFPIENEYTQSVRVTDPTKSSVHDYTITVHYSYLPSGALVMWKASNSTNFIYVLNPQQKLLAIYAVNLEKQEPTSLEVFLNDVDVIDLK